MITYIQIPRLRQSRLYLVAPLQALRRLNAYDQSMGDIEADSSGICGGMSDARRFQLIESY